MYISNCSLLPQKEVAMDSREFHQVSHSLHPFYPVLSHYSAPPAFLPQQDLHQVCVYTYNYSVDISLYIHHVTSLKLWLHYGRIDSKFPHNIIMIIFTLSMVTQHIVVG